MRVAAASGSPPAPGRRRRARFAAAFAAVLALAACAPAPPDSAPVEYLRAQFAAIDYSHVPPEQRPTLAAPFDLRAPRPPAPGEVEWREVDLPAEVGRGGGSLVGARRIAIHWYRVEHRVDPAAGPLAVYVPRFIPGIGYADLYVNGEPMDVSGLRAANHWNQPLFVQVPERLRLARERLEVLVAVSYDARTTYGLAPVWVGPIEPLQRAAALRAFLQQGGPESLSYAFLVVGLFAFGFWVRRPRETPYLLFALATVVWLLRTAHFHVEVLPVGAYAFWWLTINSMSWLMVLVYLFALRFQGRRAPWAEWAMLALVVVAGIATLPAIPLEPATVGTLAYVAQAVVGIGVTALLTADARRAGTREGWVLAAALWTNLAFALYDLALKDALVDPRGVFLLPYGAVFLFGAFLYAVLRRYAAAIDDVERVNASLEDRLATRTRELEASHEKLRAVERVQTLADERQRLMRDMHDGLGSSLMSSLVMVEQGRLEPGQVAQVLRECIDDLKLTIDSLEPIGSDLVTLLATLRYRLGRRLESAGLALEWRVSDVPPLPWLDALAALEVLRILQESLTNVIKHARARRISIETHVDGNEVRVVVEDDGRGFDVDWTAANSPGRGLPNLRRRAEKLGGRIALQSAGRGTRVELTLPIERRRDAAPVPPGRERRRARGPQAGDDPGAGVDAASDAAPHGTGT